MRKIKFELWQRAFDETFLIGFKEYSIKKWSKFIFSIQTAYQFSHKCLSFTAICRIFHDNRQTTVLTDKLLWIVDAYYQIVDCIACMEIIVASFQQKYSFSNICIVPCGPCIPGIPKDPWFPLSPFTPGAPSNPGNLPNRQTQTNHLIRSKWNFKFLKKDVRNFTLEFRIHLLGQLAL